MKEEIKKNLKSFVSIELGNECSEKKNLVMDSSESATTVKMPTHGHKRVGDDSYTVIIARAFLLFVLTFDLWMNAYILMSLDRTNLLIGTLTIVTCAVGQMSAITGQFGYPIGDTLLKVFNGGALILLGASILLGEFGNNFMTELSFFFSTLGLITGVFIMVSRARAQ